MFDLTDALIPREYFGRRNPGYPGWELYSRSDANVVSPYTRPGRCPTFRRHRHGATRPERASGSRRPAQITMDSTRYRTSNSRVASPVISSDAIHEPRPRAEERRSSYRLVGSSSGEGSSAAMIGRSPTCRLRWQGSDRGQQEADRDRSYVIVSRLAGRKILADAKRQQSRPVLAEESLIFSSWKSCPIARDDEISRELRVDVEKLTFQRVAVAERYWRRNRRMPTS